MAAQYIQLLQLLESKSPVPETMIDAMLHASAQDINVASHAHLVLTTLVELLKRNVVKTEGTASALFARAARIVETRQDLGSDVVRALYMEAFKRVLPTPGKLPSQVFAVNVLGHCLPTLQQFFVEDEESHKMLLTLLSCLSQMLVKLTEKRAQTNVLRVMLDHMTVLTLQPHGPKRLAKFSPAILCTLTSFLRRVGPIRLTRAASSALVSTLHIGIDAILQHPDCAGDIRLADRNLSHIMSDLRIFSQSHVDFDRMQLQRILMACLNESGAFPIVRAEAARQLAMLAEDAVHTVSAPSSTLMSAVLISDAVPLASSAVTPILPHHTGIFSRLLAMELRQLTGDWERDAASRSVIMGAASLLTTASANRVLEADAVWEENGLSHLLAISMQYFAPLLARQKRARVMTGEEYGQRLRPILVFMQRLSMLDAFHGMPLSQRSPLLRLFKSFSLAMAFCRTQEITFALDLRELAALSCTTFCHDADDMLAVFCRVLIIQQAVDLRVRLPATFLSLLLPQLLALQTHDNDVIRCHATAALAKIVEASRAGNLDSRDYVAEACLNFLKFGVVDAAMLVVILRLLKESHTTGEKITLRCAEEVILHVSDDAFDNQVVPAFLAYFKSVLHDRLPAKTAIQCSNDTSCLPSSYCVAVCNDLDLDNKDSISPKADELALEMTPDASAVVDPPLPADDATEDRAIEWMQRWQSVFADAIVLLSSLLLHDDVTIADRVGQLLCELAEHQGMLQIQSGAWTCIWPPLLQRMEDEACKSRSAPIRDDVPRSWQLLRHLLDADVSMSHSVRQQLKKYCNETRSDHLLRDNGLLSHIERQLFQKRSKVATRMDVSRAFDRPTWAAVF